MNNSKRLTRAQKLIDRKEQDDLRSVMIERLKKDPGFSEFKENEILTFKIASGASKMNIARVPFKTNIGDTSWNKNAVLQNSRPIHHDVIVSDKI